MLTDNMVKIQIAIESGSTVRNEKGEWISVPKSYEKSCNLPPTDDCIKCHKNGMHYWSSARIQNELFVNGIPFDEWFEQQPIGIDITKLEK